MNLEKELDYKPYVHKYEKGNQVYLKNIADQKQIESFFLSNKNMETLIESKWYLKEDDRIKLIGNELTITNKISWHMGLPFYEVISPKQIDVFYIAEFYLQTPRIADDYNGKYLGTSKDIAGHKFFAYEIQNEIHIVYESGNISIKKIEEVRNNLDKYLFTPHIEYV